MSELLEKATKAINEKIKLLGHKYDRIIVEDTLKTKSF